MIHIAREPFDQIYGAEVAAMLLKHWQEIALYQGDVPLEPDLERYRALEKAGALLCLSARDDGRPVGYAAWILAYHLHYASCKTATNDVIYLLPEYRGRTAGLRLIEESERVLIEECGAHVIRWHIKPANDWSAVLLRRGYQVEESILGKYVKRS